MTKIKNVYTYTDLEQLEQDFSKKTFIYDSYKYSTFVAKDGKTPMIKSFDTGENALRYSSFMFKVRKALGVEQPHREPITPVAPVSPVKTIEEVGAYISDCESLPSEFISTLQLSHLFSDDYENHPNIKNVDFSLLNSDHALNNLSGTFPVLFFQNGKKINIRYKWNGSKNNSGWFTLKGFGNIGAFLPHRANIKKSSTLLLVEGFKDALNANIAFEKCDILMSDSKNTTFDFSLLPDISQYKKVIFFQDKKVTDKEMLRMVQGDKNSPQKGVRELLKESIELEKFFNKISYFDYSLTEEKVTDLTDWLESLQKSRAFIKRNGLATLKKSLHKEKFTMIYNRDLAEKIDITINRAIKNNQIDIFMQQTLKKLQLKVSIQDQFNYYVSNLMKTPTNATILNLTQSKYVSQKTENIHELFKKHSHILLGSPTGTGKSSLAVGQVKKEFLDEHNEPLSKPMIEEKLRAENKRFNAQNILSEGLPLKFKNIIIIAPLTAITVEMGEHPLYTYVERTKINDLEADLNNNYVVMTTDAYENFKENPKTKSLMEERIKQAELIVFDEQHYAPQVQGFRGLVVKAYSSLHDYKGNVLYMSGTPIYSEAKHAHPVTAILDRKFISRIKYSIDPFKDEGEVLQSMREHLKEGSILFYCKSKEEANHVHNVLMQEGKTVIKITSELRNKYLKNGVEINQNDLVGIKENVVYVATTKATTGANLNRLIAVYQHGTAYDPNTFIQLTARLRGNGHYYLLKVKGEKNQNDYNQNKAINISLFAKKFNIKKLRDSWNRDDVTEYLKQHMELPHGKTDFKSFLSIYRDALQLIQSEGLGKLSEDREDYEFTIKEKEELTAEPITKVEYLDTKQIQDTFKGADSTSFRKYFERKIIDWLTRHGDIEELNRIYNLSFDYISMSKGEWEQIDAKNFITEEDSQAKEQKKEERKQQADEFMEKLEEKFNGVIEIKHLKKEGLTDTNLNKLLEDKRLDLKEHRESIIKKRTIKDKVTQLHFYLIPRPVITRTTIALILSNDGVTTLKEVSKALEQYEYLTTRKSEAPFVKFLKDFFQSSEFIKDELVFTEENIRINGKRVRNSVTLPHKALERAKSIKDREERKKALEEEARRVDEKYLDYYRSKYNCEFIYES